MLDTTAKLISVSYTGELGRMKRVETAQPIFCEVKSIDRAEYYSAFNSGLRPVCRVITDPVNYSGETLIDLLTHEERRYDIYRTYRKSADEIELWLAEKTPESEQVFTLWTAGKRVILHGAYLTGSDGAERTETGKVATDTVTLILPQALQAFCGETPVAYCRPKQYAGMLPADQEGHFYINTDCFFALGEIEADGTYQQINAANDDVYRVQSVARMTRGKPDTEYIEVVGK